MARMSAGEIANHCVAVWVILAISYVIVKPVSLNVVLYPVLLSIAVIAVVSWWRQGLVLDRTYLKLGLAWGVFISIGLVVGLLAGAPYIPQVLAYLVGVPAFFYVLVPSSTVRIIRIIFVAGLWHTIVFGLFVISSLVAIRAGVDTSILGPVNEFTGLFIRVDALGVVALTSYGLSSMIWWGPIWISSLLFRDPDSVLPNYALRACAGTIAVIVVFLSWRRGMMLAIVVLPLIILVALYMRRIHRKSKRISDVGEASSIKWRGVAPRVLACGLVAAIGVLVLQPNVLYLVRPPQLVSSVSPTEGSGSTAVVTSESPVPAVPGGIVGSKSSSAAIRQSELEALSVPESVVAAIIGQGIGVAIPRGDARPEVKPYQSELQYNQLFYSHGVVGVALICLTLALGLRIVKRGHRMSAKYSPALFVATVGTISLLVANATNPYIQAPGQYWPVLFPFMIYFAILRSTDLLPNQFKSMQFAKVSIKILN